MLSRITEKIIRQNAFVQKKESRVKFNPGLALIGLRTTGPWPITFQGEKVVDNKGLIT